MRSAPAYGHSHKQTESLRVYKEGFAFDYDQVFNQDDRNFKHPFFRGGFFGGGLGKFNFVCSTPFGILVLIDQQQLQLMQSKSKSPVDEITNPTTVATDQENKSNFFVKQQFLNRPELNTTTANLRFSMGNLSGIIPMASPAVASVAGGVSTHIQNKLHLNNSITGSVQISRKYSRTNQQLADILSSKLKNSLTAQQSPAQSQQQQQQNTKSSGFLLGINSSTFKSEGQLPLPSPKKTLSSVVPAVNASNHLIEASSADLLLSSSKGKSNGFRARKYQSERSIKLSHMKQQSATGESVLHDNKQYSSQEHIATIIPSDGLIQNAHGSQQSLVDPIDLLVQQSQNRHESTSFSPSKRFMQSTFHQHDDATEQRRSSGLLTKQSPSAIQQAIQLGSRRTKRFGVLGSGSQGTVTSSQKIPQIETTNANFFGRPLRSSLVLLPTEDANSPQIVFKKRRIDMGVMGGDEQLISPVKRSFLHSKVGSIASLLDEEIDSEGKKTAATLPTSGKTKYSYISATSSPGLFIPLISRGSQKKISGIMGSFTHLNQESQHDDGCQQEESEHNNCQQINLMAQKKQRSAINSFSTLPLVQMSPQQKKGFLVKRPVLQTTDHTNTFVLTASDQLKLNTAGHLQAERVPEKRSSQEQQMSRESLPHNDELGDSSFEMCEEFVGSSMLQDKKKEEEYCETKVAATADKKPMKIKPFVPLLDLQNLIDNGSQVNNFFDETKKAANAKTTSVIEAMQAEHTSKVPGDDHKKEMMISKMPNAMIIAMNKATAKKTSSVNNNASQGMRVQSGRSCEEIDRRDDKEGTSQAVHNDEATRMMAQSMRRPSTPVVKKLNLMNLNDKIKKTTEIISKEKEKDEGFAEIKQSRLILPTFNLSTSQTQPLLKSLVREDSMHVSSVLSVFPSGKGVKQQQSGLSQQQGVLHGNYRNSEIFSGLLKSKKN